MQFSVVIPVHNEAQNIEQLTHEIRTSLNPAHSFEILFVDDHSTDETQDKLKQLKATMQNFAYVRHARQCGQSAALCTGVQRAAYPLIITLDGDGQNDPKDIARFLAIFAEKNATHGLLLINGHRINRHDSTWRRFTSRIANQIRSSLLGDSIPDSGCGIKAFPKEVFLSLPVFNHMHRFLPALVIQQGGEIINVPVHHRKRLYGQSKYGTLDRLFCGIIDLFGVMWLGKRTIRSEFIGDEAGNE